MYEPLKSQRYPKAPITEAVIELRVGKDIEFATLEEIVERLRPQYSSAQAMRQYSAVVDNTGGSVSLKDDARGFRLSTEDQANIAMLSQRSMTAVCFAPYQDWDTLRNRARANWEEWRELAPSPPIVRIGVRFINRIDIPVSGEKVDLEEYLTLLPRADAFEATLTGFVVQVKFPAYMPKWNVAVTLTPLEPSPVPGAISFILDIDTWREQDIPADPDELWPVVDEGRGIKNDLFERALTEKTKALFK